MITAKQESENTATIASPPYQSSADQKQQVEAWFRELRQTICREMENIENEYAQQHPGLIPGKFIFTPWQRDEHEDQGGGVTGIMKGHVFEKAGVNISTVYGQFAEKFCKEIPGADSDPRFWATGISLVTHMHSPFVPTVHMNTRHIVTQKSWFGGGSDLTPTFINDDDTQDFHKSFKHACDRYDPLYYPRFKQECDNYFYLPHRQEPRGVGGIFYDYFNTGSWQNDLNFTKDIGQAFVDIYPAIVRRHMHQQWNDEHKQAQLHKRGRYVEFNLIHDRGTRFGLMTGGNIDAILMSMPPLAMWP